LDGAYWRAQLRALQDEQERAAQQAEALRGRARAMFRQMKALQEINAALEAQLQARDTAVAHLEADLKTNRGNLLRMEEQIEQLRAENQRQSALARQAEGYAAAARQELQETVAQFTQAQQMRRQLVYAVQQLKKFQSRNEALMAELVARRTEAPPPTAVAGADDVSQADIQAISGINAAYARRLQESGVHTVGDLVAQSPERLHKLAGLQEWQSAEPYAWLEEARSLLESEA
ncbi:helix-hairpin-helix domain-containing protein, partial [Arthrospira platensis SPKY1]|nr:helix-hairpin-helix domain-containing protein [Arthrospira platensis SPKY1]